MRLARLVLTAFLVVLTLSGAAGAARLRSPRSDPSFYWWRSGGLSVVYRHRAQPLVVKIIGARALPPHLWINYPDWLARSGGRIDAAQRRALTDQSMAAYAGLKGDAAFSGRYGQILPSTRSPAPGRIEQTFVRGIDWDALSPVAKMRAGASLRQIFALAQRALPGQQVDYNKYNFVFDRAGRVRAWVDWVISEPPAEAAPAPAEVAGRPAPARTDLP